MLFQTKLADFMFWVWVACALVYFYKGIRKKADRGKLFFLSAVNVLACLFLIYLSRVN